MYGSRRVLIADSYVYSAESLYAAYNTSAVQQAMFWGSKLECLG